MPWRFAAAMAMALTIIALGFEGTVVHQRHQRLDALRLERQRLETELQQVKSTADDPRPVVVLENADTRVIVPVSDRRLFHTNQQPIVY